MSGVTTFFVPIYATPGKAEELMARLTATAKATNLEEGNICYRLHRAVDNENLFYIYEQWKDQAAIDYHMSQPYLIELIEDKEGLMAQELSVTTCTEIV